MANDKNSNMVIIVVVLAALAFVAYMVMNAPDNRTTGERIGDAVDNVKEGNLDGAARSLQDRTPAQKMGDAVERAGDKIQESAE